MRPSVRDIATRASAGADEFIASWLGWTFPPVPQALRDADFTPDRADQYCRRCGDSVAEGEATDDGCGTCRKGGELSGGLADGVVRLGTYVDQLRHWLGSVKYQGWIEMGEALGAMLGRAVIADARIDLDRALVVPMPMPWQRRVYRGVDHAAVMARALARELDAPLCAALARRMHPPQVSLTPSERKRAGARGMRVRRAWGLRSSLAGSHIVLVDDIRTTGSTLRAAARLLRRLEPAKVLCAVVAVSDSRARQMRRSHRTEVGSAGGTPGSEIRRFDAKLSDCPSA